MELNKHYFSKYIGNTKLIGITQGNLYEIIITENKRGYDINIVYDITSDIRMNKMFTSSNENSIKRNWEI